MFSGQRLGLARRRRGLTAKDLATRAGVSPVTITRLELEQNEAEPDTVARLAHALDYPEAFFYLVDPHHLSKDVVSFRSLKSMSAREREAALAAGEIGIDLYFWLESRFNLPVLDLPDLGGAISPEAAAEALRQHWGLGYRPVPNMLKLLEVKGVKVLGLDENTANVDAFSFWQGNSAFIFLNSYKSAERSVFDAAHELGHLVLHKHGGGGSCDDGAISEEPRTLEIEANRFSSAFLMPEEDIRARLRGVVSVDTILQAKKRWRVSAMALAYRLRNLTRPMLTEWQYRAICIELGKRGYRSAEPEGIEREYSIVWPKVLQELWTDRKTVKHVAAQLALPTEELRKLLHGILPLNTDRAISASQPAKLRLVE